MMAWNTDLLEDQEKAAEHKGSHARLLAGPGTGKTHTLISRICYLISELQVPPKNILAITFTRAAARELRQRAEDDLGEESCPQISTLHSFALRQLIKNASRAKHLPRPLRIVDGWEERNIIFEDLKILLNLSKVNDVRDLLKELSADWQSLTADEENWEERHPNPRFLGAWKEHRKIYGYTLRSELVYQLKKVLEQRGDFKFENEIKHLIVDEYQDLNRCDLEVVSGIAFSGVELFVAGDDDQSIYGFRKAHPEGIRRFPRDYPGSKSFSLETCMRCDRNIINLGLFVARQDGQRIEKTINPNPDADEGEINILRFGDQRKEAAGIAKICNYLMKRCGYDASDIFILLRTDFRGVFSNPILSKFEEEGIPVMTVCATDPLDELMGRRFLSFMRLTIGKDDSLAWRTLIESCKNVGPKAIGEMYQIAKSRNITFAEVVNCFCEDPQILSTRVRRYVSEAIRYVSDQLDKLPTDELLDSYISYESLMNVVRVAANSLIDDKGKRESVLSEFDRVAKEVKAISIKDIIRSIGTTGKEAERDSEGNKVSIITMHQAKGLTAKAVIVAACEEERIPGLNRTGDQLGDERRLLYVSLTRAKHHLFITYCDARIDQQHYHVSGGVSSLTSFLSGGPYISKDGAAFTDSLMRED